MVNQSPNGDDQSSSKFFSRVPPTSISKSNKIKTKKSPSGASVKVLKKSPNRKVETIKESLSLSFKLEDSGSKSLMSKSAGFDPSRVSSTNSTSSKTILEMSPKKRKIKKEKGKSVERVKKTPVEEGVKNKEKLKEEVNKKEEELKEKSKKATGVEAKEKTGEAKKDTEEEEAKKKARLKRFADRKSPTLSTKAPKSKQPVTSRLSLSSPSTLVKLKSFCMLPKDLQLTPKKKDRSTSPKGKPLLKSYTPKKRDKVTNRFTLSPKAKLACTVKHSTSVKSGQSKTPSFSKSKAPVYCGKTPPKDKSVSGKKAPDPADKKSPDSVKVYRTRGPISIPRTPPESGKVSANHKLDTEAIQKRLAEAGTPLDSLITQLTCGLNEAATHYHSHYILAMQLTHSELLLLIIRLCLSEPKVALNAEAEKLMLFNRKRATLDQVIQEIRCQDVIGQMFQAIGLPHLWIGGPYKCEAKVSPCDILALSYFIETYYGKELKSTTLGPEDANGYVWLLHDYTDNELKRATQVLDFTVLATINTRINPYSASESIGNKHDRKCAKELYVQLQEELGRVYLMGYLHRWYERCSERSSIELPTNSSTSCFEPRVDAINRKRAMLKQKDEEIKQLRASTLALNASSTQLHSTSPNHNQK